VGLFLRDHEADDIVVPLVVHLGQQPLEEPA
jgi:hypothetical protein